MAVREERKKTLLLVGSIVLVAGGLAALIVVDMGDLDRVRAETARYADEIRAHDVEIAKIPDREEHVIVFREVQDRELQILPQRQQIADFHASLSRFLEEAGAEFMKVPDSMPKESDLAKGIYVTSTTVEFRADATSLLKFLNAVENDSRLVSIKGLKVKSGGRLAKGETGVVRHDVVVNLEAYFYNPQIARPVAVDIPGDERRRNDPKVRAKIAEFKPEERGTYLLRPSLSRRDPFVDVRREVVQEDPEEVRKRLEAEERVVLDLERRLDDVREKAEQEKVLQQQGDLFRLDQLGQEIDGLLNEARLSLAAVGSVRSVTVPDLVNRVERVREALDAAAGARKSVPRSLVVTSAVAEETLKSLRQSFDKGEYSAVGSLGGQWEVFLRGKSVDADARDVLRQIDALRARARLVSEFLGRGVRVQGIIFAAQDPAKSVALVNGDPHKAGDVLVERGDIKVVSIGPDFVEFGYKGITIRRGPESGAAPPKPGSRQPASKPPR